MSRDAILQRVERYYTAKLEAHGPSAQGVDWNSEESQRLRFERLLEVIREADRASVNDYGCGYGALVPLLRERLGDYSYRGFDLSSEMLESARARFGDDPACEFVGCDDALEPADYTVASGIFNVKLDEAPDAWHRYVLDTIDRLASLSTRGFAFNMLTSYSDLELMRSDLYYGDPCVFFDHCKRRHSKQVALLHDYGLYEFTIIVRLEQS